MTYSSIHVARMPNIQISIDAQTAAPLTNVTCTFNNYISNTSQNSTFTGEKNTAFVVNASSILVTKKTLILANLRGSTPNAISGDHITEFAIYDASNNTSLSQIAENKQFAVAATSTLRSQYYTTKYSCQTAYAIVEPNTEIYIKTLNGAAVSNISNTSHVLLFQIEA